MVSLPKRVGAVPNCVGVSVAVAIYPALEGGAPAGRFRLPIVVKQIVKNVVPFPTEGNIAASMDKFL